MLIFVYEYTKKAGGLAGLRFTKKFHNKAEYLTTDCPNAREIIADTTEKNAEYLIALTPEICRFTAAIEASCNDDNTVDTYSFARHLTLAVAEVLYDREYIRKNYQGTFTDSDKFEKCEVGPEQTEKNRLLRRVLTACISLYGRVDVPIVDILDNEVKAIIATRPLTLF